MPSDFDPCSQGRSLSTHAHNRRAASAIFMSPAARLPMYLKMPAGLESPPRLVRSRFYRIAEDIKARPHLYANAGRWLDREYDLMICRRRDAESGSCQRNGKCKTFADPLSRFMQAVWDRLASREEILTNNDAAVVLLMTYLMTEPDADGWPLSLTDFEVWPWGRPGSLTLCGGRHWPQSYLRGEGRWGEWVELAKKAWRRLRPRIKHADDFTSVIWYDIPYQFTKTQGIAVRLLWNEWKKGGLSASELRIAKEIGSAAASFRLAHLFRDHPAFGTMIVSAEKGIFRLAPPKSRSNHT
ncbi:MAG TPA: hypothetical protein VG269_15955 [Tepidisphaeraceae bacterium]|jgi:hypothetical protein|nr:hypothetical protein [Tepidisphaeraceae bacterium]